MLKSQVFLEGLWLLNKSSSSSHGASYWNIFSTDANIVLQDGPFVFRQEDKTSAIVSFSGFGQHSVAKLKINYLLIWLRWVFVPYGLSVVPPRLFSSCGRWAPEHTGLVAPWHM